MYLPRPGAMQHLVAGATATTAVVTARVPQGRDMLVLHRISGDPTAGGFVTLSLTPDGGTTAIPHHGNATGVQTSEQIVSYSVIYRDVTEQVVLSLSVTDGVHDLFVQELA